MKYKYLEMWKTERVLGYIDSIFDTLFLVFLWIKDWKIFFWIWLVVAIFSIIGHGIKTLNLEKKIK